MYNRYIPQSDGTYRRNRMPDHAPKPVPPPVQPESCSPESESGMPCPPPEPIRRPIPTPRSRSRPYRETEIRSIGSFLKQLLPRDLDAGDLLVILLLLLMSGDCAEDQNTALLTLALYLFL